MFRCSLYTVMRVFVSLLRFTYIAYMDICTIDQRYLTSSFAHVAHMSYGLRGVEVLLLVVSHVNRVSLADPSD